MNIQRKFLVSLICLLGAINSIAGTATPPCNEPAPVNYHITDLFTNEIRVAWDVPPNAPFEYNIKVFETSSGNMIQDFNIPGNLTIARAVNLQPGTEYEIRTAPVCSDGSISHYFASSIGTTLIIELVVNGFNLPNTDPTCGLLYKDEYCEADPEEDKIVVFRIRSISNPNVGRFFGVYNADDECTTSKIKVYPGSSPFQFYCNQSTSPICTGQQVTIKLNGDKKAVFSIWNETNGSPKHLYCTENIASGYQIVRYGDYNGVFDPVGGNCGTGGGDRSTKANAQDEDFWASIPSSPSLSANPNPFTNQLDIQIPFANINETIALHLYDLQGRIAMTMQVPGDQQTLTLSTENLSPGMYFLRAESGGIIQTIKVVKTQ